MRVTFGGENLLMALPVTLTMIPGDAHVQTHFLAGLVTGAGQADYIQAK